MWTARVLWRRIAKERKTVEMKKDAIWGDPPAVYETKRRLARFVTLEFTMGLGGA
jgi:hypothetical protein